MQSLHPCACAHRPPDAPASDSRCRMMKRDTISLAGGPTRVRVRAGRRRRRTTHDRAPRSRRTPRAADRPSGPTSHASTRAPRSRARPAARRAPSRRSRRPTVRPTDGRSRARRSRRPRRAARAAAPRVRARPSPRAPRRRPSRAADAPPRMTCHASAAPCTAPTGTPLADVTDAKRSGYAAPRTRAIAPPAESPATCTRAGSTACAAATRAASAASDGRLARIAGLVGSVEPVEALERVRPGRLLGVQHEEPEPLALGVHARAAREVLRVLRAAVQEHQQRRAARPSGRDAGTYSRQRRALEGSPHVPHVTPAGRTRRGRPGSGGRPAATRQLDARRQRHDQSRAPHLSGGSARRGTPSCRSPAC